MCGRFLSGEMLSSLCNKHYFFDVPVVVPYSVANLGILLVLRSGGYIKDFSVENSGAGERPRSINIWLRLINDRAVLTGFKLYSVPGRRIYKTKVELAKLLKYRDGGLLIVSTSKGIMSANDAVNVGVGGEFLCEVF